MSNDERENDGHSSHGGGNTTGHDWDGIKELKNPPPKWWTIGFYAGLAFVTAYYIIYPSTPFNSGFQKVVNGIFGVEVLADGHTKGIMHLINGNDYYQGYTWTREEIDELKKRGYKHLEIKAGDLKYQSGWTYVNESRYNISEIEEIRKPYIMRLKQMSVRDILDDDEMREFALGRARVLFGDNCAACHGSGGGGRVGGDYSFPNLTDDDWLYGGWPEKIVETITQGREGFMPAKGGDVSMSDKDVQILAEFVIALSEGRAKLSDEGILVKGVQEFQHANTKFQQICFACHGKNAKGAMNNKDFYTGAVNLTDGIWRFGGDYSTVVETIAKGRQAKMPTFGDKLDETSIKILAVKVHQLGGGMDAPPS